MKDLDAHELNVNHDVTLLSTCYKLLEIILWKRLKNVGKAVVFCRN